MLSFLFKNKENKCPYCQVSLPEPTRKRNCPQCNKTIYARARPGKKRKWVKEEDLQSIQFEWANPEGGFVSFSDSNRNNIREWVKSGVVKSIKIYSAEDESTCEACKLMHGKIFSIDTPDCIKKVMQNIPTYGCTNSSGCRCYYRPEYISIK